METAESFSLDAGAFRENAEGIALLDLLDGLTHSSAIDAAALHRESAELTDQPAEEWIFEKLFFRHVVDDAGIKSHANDRGIPIAFMVRCNDDGPGLWHILPPFDLESENDEEEEI